MKLLTKKAVVAAVVAAMIMSLAACGKKEEPAKTEPTATAAPTQEPTKEPTSTPTPTPEPTATPTPEPTEAPQQENLLKAALNGTQWAGIDEGKAVGLIFGDGNFTMFSPDEEENYSSTSLEYDIDETTFTIITAEGPQPFTYEIADDLSSFTTTDTDGDVTTYQRVEGGTDELNAAIAALAAGEEDNDVSMFEGTQWAGIEDGQPTGVAFVNGAVVFFIPAADGSFSQVPFSYEINGNVITASMGGITRSITYELSEDFSEVYLTDESTGETNTFSRVEGGTDELTAALAALSSGDAPEDEDEGEDNGNGEIDPESDAKYCYGYYSALRSTAWVGVDNGVLSAIIFDDETFILIFVAPDGQITQMPCEFELSEVDGTITITSPDGTEQTQFLTVEDDGSALYLTEIETSDTESKTTVYQPVEGGAEGVLDALSALAASMQ